MGLVWGAGWLRRGERFVVDGWGQWLGCGGDGSDGGRGSVGEGEGRGGGLA